MQSYPATYSENAHEDAHLAYTTISTPNDSPPQGTFSYDGHGCVASIHTFGASPSSTFSSALGSPFDDHTLRLAEPSSSAPNTPQLPSHHLRLAPSNSFLDMHPSPSTQVTSLPPASHDSREVQPPSLLEAVSAALLLQPALLTPESVSISDRRSTEVYVAAPSLQKRIILIRLSSPQPWSTFRKLALTLPKTANTGRRNTDSFNKSSKIATRTLCSEMHNARGYSIQLTRCRESKDLLHRHLGTFRPLLLKCRLHPLLSDLLMSAARRQPVQLPFIEIFNPLMLLSTHYLRLSPACNFAIRRPSCQAAFPPDLFSLLQIVLINSNFSLLHHNLIQLAVTSTIHPFGIPLHTNNSAIHSLDQRDPAVRQRSSCNILPLLFLRPILCLPIHAVVVKALWAYGTSTRYLNRAATLTRIGQSLCIETASK
jgi:hypothetical protein